MLYTQQTIVMDLGKIKYYWYIATKWFLMTFCHNWKLVSLSYVIRESSSWSRWELTHRSTTGQCEENERLWNTHSYNWNVSIKHLPSWFTESLYRNGGSKILRARGNGWQQRNLVFQTQKDWHHMYSQSLWLHTQE